MSRRAIAVTLASLAAALGAAAPAHALVVGIADQKTEMFADQRFQALGIKYARYTVGWDVLTSPWQTAQLSNWLAWARLAGVQPLISFGHSRGTGTRRTLPKPERFKYEFKRFRAMFPWVTTFATWNEANHCGEPTCHRPELVAAYYRVERIACPKCTLLAAELLDMPNMRSWVKAFRKASKVEPKYWGLHNYVDANRFRTAGTRRLLAHTKGQVWFTETGGIVARRNYSTVGFEESPAHATKAIRWVFDDLVPLSRRVTRVYLYHWNASSTTDTWDSALINPHGRARPALAVVKRVIRNGSKRHR